MRIYIAAYNQISEQELNKAINSFISKFRDVSFNDFVTSDPDVIWYLSGGSEHNALKCIEPQNKYCFIASSSNNSWAAATEVKAYLNEKGVATRIFDLDKLKSTSELQNYINSVSNSEEYRLGLIGDPAKWLVASIPDKTLLKEVLDIQTINFNWRDVNQLDRDNSKDMYFRENFINNDKVLSLFQKLNTLIKENNLNALAIDCFSFVIENEFTACLPAAALNSINFPVACEGDLCSAAGMIVFSRLMGRVPWMANLNYVDKFTAFFSHCTAPLDILNNYEITDHYETGMDSSVKGFVKNQQVTVFRIDRKLEYCFIALGEVVNTGEIASGCKTQAEIKMSTKSLFLLREFPLGNHHLIVEGDHSDILAEFFTNKGFRIV